jgi:hypothetical protein
MSEAMKLWGGSSGGGWGWGMFGSLAELAQSPDWMLRGLGAGAHADGGGAAVPAHNSTDAAWANRTVLPSRTRRIGGVGWEAHAVAGAGSPTFLVNRSGHLAAGAAYDESSSRGGEVSALQTWIAFCCVLVFSKCMGPLFQRLGLPLITAYIVSGAICGPYMLGILSKAAHDHLIYIEMFAMAFITTCAGAELIIHELRPVLASIMAQVSAISVLTFGACTVVTYVVVPPSFMGEMGDSCQFAVAMLVASIGIARSPATALAIVKELRCKGKMTVRSHTSV